MRLETQVVEDTVSLPKVSNVLVVHHDIYTERIQQFSRRELDRLDSNETRANLASFNDKRGFRGSGAPASADIAAGVSNEGDRPIFSNENEKF